MFRRVLAGWAMDTLLLRQAGLDRPCVRMTQSDSLVLKKAA